ncbi:MAG: tripartite tricarboxylate transporter substrate binding protein [Betaproteobacteria bacterium]|nr:tripartite tricarboxylate transporter substrate binding protein [Betaproteobacteria bacterium]MBI3938788.1 tripartite tricarboxylate transporter substrate binding protein [Betaproteobacteria bacterium]
MRAIALVRPATLNILLCLAGFALQSAFAQSYPVKPIRLILGFPPGGGVDVVARQLVPKLSEQLGQQVVIENRPGAGGNIAFELLANAPADGYSLMMTTPTLTVNPGLYRKVAYDPLNDFAPVAMVASTIYMLVVHPSLPVKSVKELIALAGAKPRELTYSSGGNGAAAHLAGEMFKSMTRIDVVHVPYKGIAPALVALLSGEAQLTFGSLPSTLPHVRAGKLRALAVTSAARSRFVPELPSIAEAGVPGYETTAWYGVIAPAKTPKAIVTRLASELTKVLGLEEVKGRFSSQSIEVVTSTPERFGEFIRTELAKWRNVVKTSGMRVD